MIQTIHAKELSLGKLYLVGFIPYPQLFRILPEHFFSIVMNASTNNNPRKSSWDLNLCHNVLPPSPLQCPATKRRPKLKFNDDINDSDSDDNQGPCKLRRRESLPTPTDVQEMKRLLHGNLQDHDGEWVREKFNSTGNLAIEETPLSLRWGNNVNYSNNSTDEQSDEECFQDPEDSTTHSEGQTLYGTVIETVGDAVTEAWNYLEETKEEVWEELQEKSHYDWRQFWKGGGPIMFIRWLLTGFAANAKLNDEEIQENLNCLARLLTLLREYHDTYGMPSKGGPKDREYVLREIIKDLYAGGAPMWTLQPVMTKVAEGLTGKRGVDFFMLPRRAFIFAPSSGATIMFPISRGYDMHKLDEMEKVAVRLASFASNSSSVSNIPARFPNPREMRLAFRADSMYGEPKLKSQEEMAEEILSLASEAEGLFFFINSSKYKQSVAIHRSNANDQIRDAIRSERESSPTDLEVAATIADVRNSQLFEFWHVEGHIQELFCRLATVEAIGSIDKMDAERITIYSPLTIMCFRIGAAAGACAFWFQGSWYDMAVAGIMSIFVAFLGASQFLSKQERIIFETVVSYGVGFLATAISVNWPNKFCFSAIAISALLDVLQGFRVVYAIMEIMSRHTVTGGADLMEGIFFTALIAYFLKFGQFTALSFMGIDHAGDPDTNSELHKEYMICDNGINEWWFLLLVPMSAICWSGLFNPSYYDLPVMAFHGITGYVISWQFNFAAPSSSLNNFMAALCITFCAGIVSRFTGRQALGNTVAGLYVLVPGVYMLTTVYSDKIEGFLTSIILRAVIIGIGAWTGTILCSPTLLGTNRGLINHGGGLGFQSDSSVGSMNSYLEITSTFSGSWKRRDKSVRRQGTGAMLFF